MTSKISQAFSNLRSRLIRNNRSPLKLTRELIAETYVHGVGIEIGALHNPLKLPTAALVRYVDRLSVPELRKQYPELESKATRERGYFG